MCILCSCTLKNYNKLLTDNDVKYWHQINCQATYAFEKGNKLSKKCTYGGAWTSFPFEEAKYANYSVVGKNLIVKWEGEEIEDSCVTDSLSILKLSKNRLKVFSKTSGELIECTSDFIVYPENLGYECDRYIYRTMLDKLSKVLRKRGKTNVSSVYGDLVKFPITRKSIPLVYVNKDSLYIHNNEFFLDFSDTEKIGNRYCKYCQYGRIRIIGNMYERETVFLWKFWFKKENDKMKYIKYEKYKLSD